MFNILYTYNILPEIIVRILLSLNFAAGAGPPKLSARNVLPKIVKLIAYRSPAKFSLPMQGNHKCSWATHLSANAFPTIDKSPKYTSNPAENFGRLAVRSFPRLVKKA